MTEYGLPHVRTDGELNAVDHTYEWNGQEITIKLVPPTLEQLQEYEDFGDDVDTARLEEVVNRHVVEPDQDASEMTIQEILCYLEGVIDHGRNGGGAFVEEAREHANQLQDDEGNGTASSD